MFFVFITTRKYKLLEWVNIDKIDWRELSINPAAIHILEQNMDKIDWNSLSRNPAAIHLLEKNVHKIDWLWLSINPAAIHLLRKNVDKINWNGYQKIQQLFIYLKTI